MSLIDLLIAPITEDNIVNNIRLEKKSPIPFASKILPNSKRRKNYEFKYNNKQFNTILQGSKKIITDHSIDVKASAQLGWAVDTSNELEYLNYILNTSIYKLRKIKPQHYMGLRIGNMQGKPEDMKLYNFSERWVAPLIDYDEGEKIIRYAKDRKEPMLDPALFRSVFNDKHSYRPILPSMLEDAEDTGYEAPTPAEKLSKIVPDTIQKEIEKAEEEEKEERKKQKRLKKQKKAEKTEIAEERPIVVLNPGLVRSPSDPVYIPYPQSEENHQYLSREESYKQAVFTSHRKTKRNKIIRNILLKNGITPPGRIRDSFVDRILYDDTSEVDPAVCKIIKRELERQNLIV